MSTFGDDSATMKLPSYDMLWISYDKPEADTPPQFAVVLPYCEVADGDIVELNPGGIVINKKEELINLDYPQFVKLIEKGMQNGKITYLMVQMKESPKVIQIPVK
jgi:hypothetical protein